MLEALGLIETVSLVAAIEAADTMTKSARVELIGMEKIGCAFLTITVRGTLANVRQAVAAGAAAASRVGGLVSALVIPRPDPQIDDRFPVRRPRPGDDFVCHC
jgi:microcompartment protein CcmL/EutN